MSTSGATDNGGAAIFPDYAGDGSPEAVVTAAVGKSYLDTTNGAVWFKATGTGDTGWVNAGGATGVFTAPGASGVTTIPIAIKSTPAASVTATAAFSTLAVDTPLQSSLGYDVLVSGVIRITSATAGTIALGVGPTSTPTASPYLAAFTSATAVALPYAAVVPAGYYLSLVSGGTIVIAAITAVATPL